MPNEYQQVNTNIDLDTIAQLDKMTHEEGDISRSAFFRKLIRQEFARRHPFNANGYENHTIDNHPHSSNHLKR